MKLEKMLEAGIGLYLLLPGIEDAATGGATILPSAVIGGALIGHAFGVKIW